MRFLADEHISPQSIALIKEAGYEVFSVRNLFKGEPDIGVLRYAIKAILDS